MSRYLESLRAFDVFNKTAEEHRIKTFAGGLTTLLCVVVMVILVSSEFIHFLSDKQTDELFVDVSRQKRLMIHFDVEISKIPCSILSMEVHDYSGNHQHGVEKTVKRQTVASDGRISDWQTQTALQSANLCGSCYGAESEKRKCCATCSDVLEAYLEKGWALDNLNQFDVCKKENDEAKKAPIGKEGCRLSGNLNVSRAAGSVHFVPGRTMTAGKMHIHDMDQFKIKDFNLSHLFHHFSFGDSFPNKDLPLDALLVTDLKGAGTYTYRLKVVPTMVQTLKHSDDQLLSYQFSTAVQEKHSEAFGSGGSSAFPGIQIHYEMSPIMVKYSHSSRSFMHFLTNLCAIIGGIFTIAGIIDYFTFLAQKWMNNNINRLPSK